MDYLLIVMASVCISIQFCLTKAYQRRTLNPGEKMSAALEKSAFFSMGSGLAAFLFFWLTAGFQVQFSGFSLMISLCLNAVNIVSLLLSLLVISMGEISVYTLFIMLGGTLLPFLFGVLFWEERLSPARTAGIILLILSLLLPVFGSRRAGKKGSGLFFLLCTLVFFLNGTTGILSKIHQTTDGAVNAESFMVINNGILFGMAGLLFLILRLRRIRRSPRERSASESPDGQAERPGRAFAFRCGLIALYAVISGAAFLFQLIGAVTLDASLLYPMVTGGTIVLGTLFGWIFFREKPGPASWLSTGTALFATLLFLF